MNIKSYLRGIGAGMIVTALVMGVSNNNGHKMTEAEIISEAKRLGMVESSTLLEMNKENVSSASVSSIPVSEGKKDVSVDTSAKDREPDVTLPVEPVTYETEDEDSSASTDSTMVVGDPLKETDETDEIESQTPEPEAIDPMPAGEAGFESGDDYVTIRVIRGDSSVSVSRRIFEAGLVESAVELDRYLCKNGYDKSISVGEYQIPMGSDFEEISKIITRRK